MRLLDLPYHCIGAWVADLQKVAECLEDQASLIVVAIAQRGEDMLVVERPCVLVLGMKYRRHKMMCDRKAGVDDKLEHPSLEPCHQTGEECLGESRCCMTCQT